jgi:hypothetical protein
LRNPPLGLVGYFLRVLGNHFLNFARQHKGDMNLLYNEHEV